VSVVTVYRYNNAGQNDHLYTANPDEIGTTHNGQAGKHGFVCEGASFSLFNHHHHGLHPVYRYFCEPHHDHFYTANPNEIGTTTPGQMGHHNYKCEGVLGYISPHEFPGAIPVHRYYREEFHDHFYTCKVEEIGTTHVGSVGHHGYKYEGVLGYAYPAEHHVHAVYRYHNENTHDHLYTTNQGEIGTVHSGAVGHHGYKSEGIGFYIFNSHHHGLVPLYRYWNNGATDHLYSSNPGEIGVTQSGQSGASGYVCEGVLGYVSPVEFFGSIPIYRYWNGATSDHFYTTNAGEIGTTHPGHAGNHGYTCEGIVGYVPHH